MSTPRTVLDEAFAALRQDLVHPDGPRISTMRNYRYAIVPYDPADEFKLRTNVQRLCGSLTAAGWVVLTLSLHKLLLQRVRALGDELVGRLIAAERSAAAVEPERIMCAPEKPVTVIVRPHNPTMICA